jgi:tetratricopeptide (TPR) repeat protein
MSNANAQAPNAAIPEQITAPAAKSAPPVVPRTPPLFRRTDWLTFLITFAAVWIGYYLTLAPELTLEDSGELATGSYYAGIPHPPGYPVWTIYTWLWTVLLPVGNIAWRVALGEATSGALAAGLLALLVSRGSSLLMEGIEDLKNMAGGWESAICTVSGFVAGMLLGFNGFMWSQSVIVEVYSFSVASLMIVLLCLMRWIYAPHQRRYLFYALFFHGLCFTNHQTLIVAALGIEVAIAAADIKLGRNLWLGNSIIYLCGYILVQEHILTALEANKAVFVIFNVVGVCSIALYIWFIFLSKENFLELSRDGAMAATFLLVAVAPSGGAICWVLSLVSAAGFCVLAVKTWHLGLEWLILIALLFCWLFGASFYFYMPLAGMTDPPMQWGYPRTVEGFIHAFTRGQYEKTNPTDIIGDPKRFATQLHMLMTGIVEEFNSVYTFLALVPFAFFRKLHRRERAWIIGITAIYFFLGVLLLILLNPPPDRAAQSLVRVFFTASHTLIALMVGYGLTLIAAYMATHYERFRFFGLIGGAFGICLALYSFVTVTTETYFGQDAEPELGKLLSFAGHAFINGDQYGLPVFAGLILIGLTAAFVAALYVYRSRAPLAITLAIFALMPLHSIMTHWSDNEQRNHWFGYWFGHDMFSPPFKDANGKPLYPEMARNTVLFGGTDPGRFCPTYTIFCESFIPHHCQPAEDQNFDRRDVYIITQNALADGTYLNYIRAQYMRSTEKPPPFFAGLVDFLETQALPKDQRDAKAKGEYFQLTTAAKVIGKLDAVAKPLDRYFTDLGANIEKRRRTFTSWFVGQDFTDVPALAFKLKPGATQDAVSKFIYDNLSPRTRQLLEGQGDSAALREGLAKDLNQLMERELDALTRTSALKDEKDALTQNTTGAGAAQRAAAIDKEIGELKKVPTLYDSARFQGVTLSDYLQDFIKQNPQSHTRVRLDRLLLEAAYPNLIAHSLGGVYPDREIYTPSPDDNSRCFQEYMADAQKRLMHDAQFPNEPKQVKPGEDVHLVGNNVSVSGQVAVMAINGLLTKVIFDHNPKNEFYVEESMPLDWMYPYLTPFGIIMKMNRHPLPELSEDIIKRDHEFWKQYSKRLTGDVVDYNTSVKDIAAFVEKVYLRRDYSGFKGDRKFIRDDQAQKSFSKLRSSIAGVYAWRVTDPSNRSGVVQQRMIKEADFSFRQAFAFCPYSPEAVFRYVNFLLALQRFDDALVVAETCQKLDPFNSQVVGLVNNLRNFQRTRQTGQPPAEAAPTLAQLEKAVVENPANFQLAFDLAAAYLQMQQTNKAVETLDRVLNDPRADGNAVLAVAQAYASISMFPKLEVTLERLVKLAPDSPEAAYDLAAIKSVLGKTQESLVNLKRALDLNAKRRVEDTNALDLRQNLLQQNPPDHRFDSIRQTTEFKEWTKATQ